MENPVVDDNIPNSNKRKHAIEKQPNRKLENKILSQQNKRIKPGECLKYVTTIIDPDIINLPIASSLLNNLSTLGVSVDITQQILPNVITWKRSILQQTIAAPASTKQINATEKYIDEKNMLVLMMAEELNETITNAKLIKYIKSIKQLYGDNKQITLLIYGLKDFCRKNNKNVGRFQFENGLTELQICENVSHRLLETAADFGNIVMQFTKSIAEIPFKKQESDKLNEQNIYLVNDNKDCVTIKDTTGLTNLWQHHLIKLPLVTLETAEAILNEYPMPKNLIDAYERSSNGQDLLANIPVRRAGGPLTSVRKIGQELSRKIYELYTNLDPNYII